MHVSRDHPYPSHRGHTGQGDRLAVVGLLVVLVVTPLALLRFTGSPHLPPALPDPRAIHEALTSNHPDLSGALPWCILGVWLLWLWLLVSVVLQATLAALDMLTRGAAWVRAPRPLVDACTTTLVKRAVTGFVATTFFLEGLKLSAVGASAAPGPPPIVMTVTDPLGTSSNEFSGNYRNIIEQTIEHIVVPGDTLWGLAERYYGDGHDWPRIATANQGRVMPDGRIFTGVLWPGDILLVPNPTYGGTTTDGSGTETSYVVKSGDTLRGIAQEQLGDETRWTELEVAGQGPVLQALANPDLIYPGLRLVIPSPSAAAQPNSVPTPAPLPPSLPPPPAPPPVMTPPAPPPAVSTPATPTASPATSAAMPAITPTISPTQPRRSMTTPSTSVPSPTATVIPAATALPTPALNAPNQSGSPTNARPVHLPGREVVGIGAGLVAGVAMLLAAKRLLRWKMRTAPMPAAWDEDVEDTPRDFVATDEPVHAFEHRVQGGETEPAVVVASHTARFLSEEGITDTQILLATHERGRSTLALRAPDADHARLVTLASTLGARLGGKGKVTIPQGSGEVELRLSGIKAAALLGAAYGATTGYPAPQLVPFAAQPNGATVFANWDALGHILIVGDDGEGVETVLTSLIAELASRRSPDDLRLWAVAHPRVLPHDLLRLPHWGRMEPFAPDDPNKVVPLLDALRAELVERIDEAASDQPVELPEIVLVLGELADPLDDGCAGTTLELLGREGANHGIRILAATMRPAELPDSLLPYFATRFVLELAEEAQSVRFLGTPGAVGVGGGRLLPRLAGRPPAVFNAVPPRLLRGQRITPEELTTLVTAIRQHYGSVTGVFEDGQLSEQPVHEVVADEATPNSEDANQRDKPIPDALLSNSSEGQGNDSAASHSAAMATDPTGPMPVVRTASNASTKTKGEMSAEKTISPDLARTASSTRSHGVAVLDPSDESNVLATSTPTSQQSHPESPNSSCQQASTDQAREHASHVLVEDGSSVNRSATVTPSEGAGAYAKSKASSATDLAESSIVNGATPAAPHSEKRPVASTPEPKPLRITLHCFGGPLRIRYGESELSDQNRQQQRSLLAFLAVAPPGPVDTDRIREALWPDQDPRQSQEWLHKAVWQLRKLLTDQIPGLPSQVVRSGRNGTYSLDLELVASDVHHFYHLLDDMQRLPVEEAVDAFRNATVLLADDLLVGEKFSWLDADPDGDGLRPVDRLARALRRRADVLTRRCRVVNRHQLAVQIYELLLESKPTDEPLDEKILRELFKSHFAAGNLAGLLRAEREGRTWLRTEYTVPDLPDDPVEDQQLYEFDPDTEKLLQEFKTKLGAMETAGRISSPIPDPACSRAAGAEQAN